jgi:hypothetical protein
MIQITLDNLPSDETHYRFSMRDPQLAYDCVRTEGTTEIEHRFWLPGSNHTYHVITRRASAVSPWDSFELYRASFGIAKNMPLLACGEIDTQHMVAYVDGGIYYAPIESEPSAYRAAIRACARFIIGTR